MTQCHDAPVSTAVLSANRSLGRRRITLAVGGNPNSGKTTLFNHLTGLRQKVANYAGATVEKKLGLFQTSKTDVEVIDLPGTYGLTPKSEEERIAAEVILGINKEVPRPAGVLCVVDSTALEKSLYLVLQVLETGLPAAVLLNMSDELKLRGAEIDEKELERLLNVPVLSIVATRGGNFGDLKALIDEWPEASSSSLLCRLPVVPTLTEAASRRRQAHQIAERVLKKPVQPHPWSDKVDAIVMHKVWGPLLFALIVLIVFQSIFSWAQPFMNLIDAGFSSLGNETRHLLPTGFLNSFISDGVITGVGAVVIFLPQILIVFFFISILENFGYLPRAAMVMDRLLHAVGLQGKSFLPLISSYACAIPGIMATRTIENKRDRLATIFVAPFMTCSARLPVYALLISAFVPDKPVLGHFFRLRAMTLLGLYAAGFVAALITAGLLNSSILKSSGTPFFIEMPPYRIPAVRTILLVMWERSKVFLRQAGTVILGVNIALWFLVSYPKKQGHTDVQNSYAGRMGKWMAPAIHPLGFNWKVGIGLISAQAAREVMISTLATIYRVQAKEDNRERLQSALKKDMTPLAAISLMLFFAFAMQCSSTLAVVRRETGNWKMPVLMFAYMNLVAYGASLSIYQLGHFLGMG